MMGAWVSQPTLPKTRNVHDLSALSPESATAFAASCCERMLPHYEAFVSDERWGDVTPLRLALDAVWKHIEGTRLSVEEGRRLLVHLDRVTPDTEDFDSRYVSAALDAASAIYAAVECCLGDACSHANVAAELATDTIDMFVQVSRDLDPNDPALDSLILEDPLMVREMAKQAADLELLRHGIADEISVARFRAGAMPDGLSSLGLRMGNADP